MTMENTRVVGSADHFPVGLRVLAVDDDRACLKLLEALLRRCQYHVTVTNQAIDALKLLRDNKNKFDLVISDVHMPDMDGFKLLELVGLEMDLPVIMLSGNSDPKAVMKGITHGACDYLLKPVRLEELKNIWQHVVRRKRFDSRDVNSYDHVDEDTDADGSKLPISHHAHAPGLTASSELNTERSSRKRKDQDEGEDDDFDDNDDSSMQKKPRVVWSIELHRKFVAAVNQLGIDKAMPKRILDLMNDEKLTRENVASHLQKYRLYLKRISSVTSHQANMVAALGGKDSPYLQIGSSLENARNNYHSFTTSGNLSTLASFQQGQGQGCGGSGGMFGILNCPTGPSASGLYNLASSGMIQLGYGRSNNNPPTIHDLGRLQQSISFSGGGTQAQAPKMSCSSDVGALSPVANSFLDTLKQPSQPKQHSGLFNNQPILASTSTPTSRIAATLSGDPFEMKTGSSSIQTDEFCTGSRNAPAWSGIINDTWYENLASSSKLGEIVGRNNPNMKANTCSDDMLASLPLSTTDDRLGLSVSDMIAAGGSGSKPSSWFEGTVQMTNFNYNSPANSTLVGTCNREDFIINGVTTNDDNMVNGSFNLAPVYTTQNSELDQVVGGTKMQGGGGGGGGFDGLISAIVKRERDEVLMEGDIGCDIYSLETCM